jgi:hypothetical protein
MKRAPYLTTLTLGLFAFTTGANADPVPSDPPVNPYVDTDGDGVPLAVSHPNSVKPSPEQLEDERKAQEKADADKNWLVRGYEEQLKAHAAANPSNNESSNLYYELSKNKELAKLAGITPIDSDEADASSEDKTNQAPATPDSTLMHPDAYTTASSNPLSTAFGLKPLISPLSAPDAAGIHNFYSSLPVAMPSPLTSSIPGAASATSQQSEDSTDMETPGMTAAKTDPMANLDTPDLTLDVLPGETIEQAKANRANNNNLELPQPMNADQLHQTLPTALSLQPPSNTTQKTPTLPPVVKPVQTYDADAPTPVSQQPVIVPVHAPIANPYDILNR